MLLCFVCVKAGSNFVIMELAVPTWLAVVITTGTCIVIYSKWKHRFFSKYGIPGPTPKFIFGIFPCYKKNGLVWTDVQLVSTYGDVVGIYHGHNPVVLIADPEMIKEVTVKCSDVLLNRAVSFDTCGILGSSVALAENDYWKCLHNKFIPVFSKDNIQQISPAIEECLETLVENIKTFSASGESFDFRRHCGHVSMDMLMRVLLGCKVNSAKEEDDIRVIHAINAWKSGTEGAMKLGALCALCPQMRRVLRYFNVSPCPREVTDFFTKLTKDRLDQSEAVNPNDFLHFMAEQIDNENNNSSGEKEPKGLSKYEITANIIFMIMAGYDTTANALAFLAHCLATNTDCQDRLLHEIKTKISDEKLTYDNIMALPYLDKLVSETLRLFPPMVRFNRRASADVKVCGRLIPRGVEVCVPVFAVHRDPRVWSDPDKFDPERFSREQSASRPDFSYIPFGAGPRCCIASQFALFQIKLAMVYLSKHFYFQTAPETEMPPKLENGGFSRAKNGIWLRIRPS